MISIMTYKISKKFNMFNPKNKPSIPPTAPVNKEWFNIILFIIAKMINIKILNVIKSFGISY